MRDNLLPGVRWLVPVRWRMTLEGNYLSSPSNEAKKNTGARVTEGCFKGFKCLASAEDHCRPNHSSRINTDITFSILPKVNEDKAPSSKMGKCDSVYYPPKFMPGRWCY